MLDFNNLPAQDKIYYKDSACVVYCADNREILPCLSGIDSIVTDPPYELGFMGKSWDKTGIAYDLNVWQGCLNTLLSGSHLLAFSGTRTYHRMACAIEDAGFDIRDMVEWMYGSGFPKSLDIGKAIDKLQGNEREVIGTGHSGYCVAISKIRVEQGYRPNLTKCITETTITKGNSEFEGWGTALKPAHEPICLARKPLSEKTVASNVLKYGTGGLNIDGCRVEYLSEADKASAVPQGRITTKDGHSGVGAVVGGVNNYEIDREQWIKEKQKGRFPANLIHDGSQVVMELFPQSKGGTGETKVYGEYHNDKRFNASKQVNRLSYSGDGSAARFFYCAKASRSERDRGCEEMPIAKNTHPTVKPLALMSYLIKLITPPNGIILDPFCGSGSTLVAAKQLGYKAIGIELDEKSCEISKARVMQLEIPKEDVKTETML